MRTTSVVEPPRPSAPVSSTHSPQIGPVGFLRGPLIVTGLVSFSILLLIANFVALPVRLVRRLLHR